MSVKKKFESAAILTSKQGFLASMHPVLHSSGMIPGDHQVIAFFALCLVSFTIDLAADLTLIYIYPWQEGNTKDKIVTL